MAFCDAFRVAIVSFLAMLLSNNCATWLVQFAGKSPFMRRFFRCEDRVAQVLAVGGQQDGAARGALMIDRQPHGAVAFAGQPIGQPLGEAGSNVLHDQHWQWEILRQAARA